MAPTGSLASCEETRESISRFLCKLKVREVKEAHSTHAVMTLSIDLNI